MLSNYNVYLMPLKREIWENKRSFIYAPIAILVIYTIVAAVLLLLSNIDVKMTVADNVDISAISQIDEDEFIELPYRDTLIDQDYAVEDHIVENRPAFGSDAVEIFSWSLFGILSIWLFIVSISYALASLYNDRKDKSILFWKSMPVSETQNVLTKLFVTAVLLPSIVLASILVAGLFLIILGSILKMGGALFADIHILAGIREYFRMIASLSFYVILSLPIICWLFFCSASARKSPLLLAMLPIFFLMIIEQMIIGEGNLFASIYSRTFGAIAKESTSYSHISSFSLWMGLAIAAALSALTIWWRNHKFE